MPRAVSGGKDVRIGRPRPRIDDDAIVNSQSGICRQCDHRHDTDADQHDVGGMHLAMAVGHMLGPAVSADLRDTGLQQDTHPFRPVCSLVEA